MPTFDFRCGKCGTVFEETVKFGTKTFPPCPSCGSKNVEKLLSAPGIVFKGSGFYKTDTVRKESKSEPKTPDAPQKETPKPSETKSENSGTKKP